MPISSFSTRIMISRTSLSVLCSESPNCSECPTDAARAPLPTAAMATARKLLRNTQGVGLHNANLKRTLKSQRLQKNKHTLILGVYAYGMITAANNTYARITYDSVKQMHTYAPLVIA